MDEKEKISSRSKYALFLLLLIYINNQWTRYLLNYLYAVSSDDEYKSIKVATNLSSSQYGLLVGFGFGLTYVAFGMIMGRASDIYNRINIIAVGLLIWNGAILLMGLSSSFSTLLIARVILGIGESFSGPASYSLLADFFPPSRRGEANGIYAFGVYIGGGMSSLSLTLALTIGWRNTCYLAALTGIFLAFVLRLTLTEPERAGQVISSSSSNQQDSKISLKSTFKSIFGHSLVVSLLVASTVRFAAGYVIGGYLPSFFSEKFPDDSSLYSYLNASVVSIGGATSAYLGGKIADKWLIKGEYRANVFVPGIGALAAIPALAAVLYSSNFSQSMASLFVEYLFAECWFGPAMSALQGGLPPRARGTGVATFALMTTLGGSTATWAVGLALNTNEDDPDLLSLVVLLSAGGAYAISGILFFCAAAFIKSERPEGYAELKGTSEEE
eukprot:CAMPEP_0171462658 /NCGR_PEP_ID=MMETSP0945-20130129/6603_1 /TAXON_ID=109269 /ORGANISM="Vaucheria litorea, Strain CCMP2940" /LENGTH=442 /DNA_ID=CAMNT_0011989219 /DNA_START=64 /DNA_END=1392 /DNA_ORIENTATION=-